MKNIKSILASYILAILAITTFVGCVENAAIDGNKQKYETHLSLKNGKLCLHNPSDVDYQASVEAFKRMDVQTDQNGKMYIPFKSGKEVNISEELFLQIKELVDNSNKNLCDLSNKEALMKNGKVK